MLNAAPPAQSSSQTRSAGRQTMSTAPIPSASRAVEQPAGLGQRTYVVTVPLKVSVPPLTVISARIAEVSPLTVVVPAAEGRIAAVMLDAASSVRVPPPNWTVPAPV